MKLKLLLLIFLLYVIGLNAQSIYNFETENITYENLAGSTSLNNGDVWDDPAYTIPMGFDFKISSHTFSTIYIVEWNVGAVLSSRPDDNGIQPLFVPVGQDIIDLGYATGTSQSNISYKTEGTVGSQIFKIEWKNVGFYDDLTELDFMNFQMWLYEGTNVIEYRYGPSEINNPSGSFEGETGLFVNLATSIDMDNGELEDNAYIVTENPSNPTLIIIEPGNPDPGEDEALNGMVPDGTVYRFGPQQLSVEDFAAVDFKIFPNPASDYLNIQTKASEYNFSIYNSLGQVMNANSVENRIDISNLSNGIYFIKIETESGSATKKFIKQ
ncbi:MAG: T9SS type A sorting domain-containing protein [Aequorivita sp.]|nr:T9SS type A sorting domain-containing protein [Aequorivita sp.]